MPGVSLCWKLLGAIWGVPVWPQHCPCSLCHFHVLEKHGYAGPTLEVVLRKKKYQMQTVIRFWDWWGPEETLDLVWLVSLGLIQQFHFAVQAGLWGQLHCRYIGLGMRFSKIPTWSVQAAEINFLIPQTLGLWVCFFFFLFRAKGFQILSQTSGYLSENTFLGKYRTNPNLNKAAEFTFSFGTHCNSPYTGLASCVAQNHW